MNNYRQKQNYENVQRRIFPGVGEYGIPEIYPVLYGELGELISFNYAKTEKSPEEKSIHFFVDDYQFLRVWNTPDRYIPILQKFKYVLSPDFSTYTDFPKAIQIYNHYRKHWTAAYWQLHGIKVIPTISWSTPDSFEWCFDGEPHNSTVAISSTGTQNSKEKKRLFLQGYEAMLERLHPERIIFYGQIPDECKGNIIRVRAFQDKFREGICNGW